MPGPVSGILYTFSHLMLMPCQVDHIISNLQDEIPEAREGTLPKVTQNVDGKATAGTQASNFQYQILAPGPWGPSLHTFFGIK